MIIEFLYNSYHKAYKELKKYLKKEEKFLDNLQIPLHKVVLSFFKDFKEEELKENLTDLHLLLIILVVFFIIEGLSLYLGELNYSLEESRVLFILNRLAREGLDY